MTKVIKEEQDAKPDSYGICDFQNSKMIGNLSCNLCINLIKKAANVYVIIKCHNRKSGTEKVARPTKIILHHCQMMPGPGLFLNVMIKFSSPIVLISRSGSFF